MKKSLKGPKNTVVNHLKDHYILNKFEDQGKRSRSKLCEHPVFCLVSDNAVQSQDHKGQAQQLQRSRSNIIGQHHKVKFVWGVFMSHQLAEGATQGHFH